MRRDRSADRDCYELRLRGLLGPLLLDALPHTAVSLVPQHVLVVTSTDDGPALMQLLERLVSGGAEVDSIRQVEDPAAGPARGG